MSTHPPQRITVLVKDEHDQRCISAAARALGTSPGGYLLFAGLNMFRCFPTLATARKTVREVEKWERRRKRALDLATKRAQRKLALAEKAAQKARKQ